MWQCSGPEIFCPTKHDNVSSLMKDTMCFFKFPAIDLSALVWKSSFQTIEKINRHSLQFRQFACCHVEFSLLHLPLQCLKVNFNYIIRWILHKRCPMKRFARLGTFDFRVDIFHLQGIFNVNAWMSCMYKCYM